MASNRKCSVVGCNRPMLAKGLCSGHYQRLKISGDVLPLIPIGTKTGSRNPKWRGGEVRSEGRVYIFAPNHPYPNLSNTYVARYRLVMEKKLGRYLLPTELVHHKNEITDDDREENLEIKTHSTHATLHNADRPRNAKGQWIRESRTA